jgi:ABC-type Na+ efflux pump permease subunit
VTATTYATRAKVAPYVAGGLLLGGCVALAIVDPTDGPPLCPFKAVTGLDCPGCGGTRAAHQLFTGNLGAALSFNVLAVLAIPFLLWALFVSLTAMLGGPRWRNVSLLSPWTRVAVVVIAVFWVARNLPFAPFDWLGTGT